MKTLKYDSVDKMCADLLRDGLSLHIASTMSRPNALLFALARVARGRRQYVISSNALHGGVHALVMAGVVKKAIFAFAGDTTPRPRPNPLYREIPKGVPFRAEEWSLFTLHARLRAAAEGQLYAVNNYLTGTDLGFPLDGKYESMLPALKPDITLLHAVCQDNVGNLYIAGPTGESYIGAMAANDGVVATVEEIVDYPQPEWNIIPADRVIATCVVPGGAHPQGMYCPPELSVKSYADDIAFQAELADACTDPDKRTQWYRLWIDKPSALYERREQVVRVGLNLAVATSQGFSDDNSNQIIAQSSKVKACLIAARALVDILTKKDIHNIMAGIGISQIAAWIAADWLNSQGHIVQVHTEHGMIDAPPLVRDTFLFSQQRVARCRSFSSTEFVAGSLCKKDSCVAVLSVGQIDIEGNGNSSRTDEGDFLVGSGGACDFAASMETVIVAPLSKKRYVHRVPFITFNGSNVTHIICEYGRITRRSSEDKFVISSWNETTNDDPTHFLFEKTDWRLRLGNNFKLEHSLNNEELSTIAKYNWEGILI